MKKAVALVLACLVLLSFSSTAFALKESNAYISRYSALISNPSSGVVRVDFYVYGTGTMSSLGASSIVLYENGVPVKTFSMYDPLYASTMVTTNEDWFYGYVTYSANSGSTYTAYVTVFASDGYGSGSESCTAGSVYIP